jgi:glutathione S-transferase
MSYAKIPVRLITIPVSHYCEKTRWALTKLQIPFVEERHMPPFHRFVTRKIPMGSNSIVVAETENHTSALNRFIFQRVGGQSVPVLVTQTGVLTNSEDISRYVDALASDKTKLYPTDPVQLQKIEELVKLFDSVLAPAVRQWFYFYAFDQS